MTIEAGTVTKLEDLVAYQDGAVVSRVLLRGDKGSVTAFAFDEGEALTEHTTPADALLHVIEGTAAVEVSGSHHDVGAGELILLPANEPHAVRAPERFKMLLVMLRA